MVPFLKWAGGKSRLVGYMDTIVKNSGCKRLVEPFVGAGSVFMAFQDRFERIRINDINPDLMNCYASIKDHFEDFMSIYSRLCHAYRVTSKKEEMYYQLREIYNRRNLGMVEHAACMIVLNKTCYNGLYRVNSKGEFNVAWGKRLTPMFSPRVELEGVSQILQKTELSAMDFESVEIERGDLVYFDPPYQQIDDNFTSYTKNGFHFNDQIRLKNLMIDLAAQGISFMMSNSYFQNLRSWFPLDWIKVVSLSRCMAPDADNRFGENEVIVSNRW